MLQDLHSLQLRDSLTSHHQDCKDDLATLTAHMNEMRAAKEFAERDLAKTKRMLEETRNDWQKKLRERRREVSSEED